MTMHCGKPGWWRFGVLAAWLVAALVAGEPSADDAPSERVRWLRAEVARHDEKYFKQAAPEITDFAYDALKRELRELEQRHPELATSGTTASLGDDRTGLFPTYRHRERMLSLAKCRTEADLRAFLGKLGGQLGSDRLTYVVEPKYDGLAISVTYENGKLVRAVTRGDGTEGDDVTENIRTIRTLPGELRATSSDGATNPIPGVVELRGEVFIGDEEFARINREREAAGEAPFATPRNLAAGTLKLLDPADVATRRLEIVFYGWGAWETATTVPASQRELHALIRGWGLPAVENYRVAEDADEVWRAVQEFGRQRSGWAYPTDGVVVKLDDVELRKRVGESNEAPLWAIAYKFAPERVMTRLRGITLQVGRTGVLTPVAELEPVQVAGTSVSRASLHNREEIARGDYRIGDYVWVEKAGEIIPQLTGVDLARRAPELPPYEFPNQCPACQSFVVQEPDEVAVRCGNYSCPAQVRRRIEYFVSRSCVAIDGLGPVTVDALVTSGRMKNAADLYSLTRGDLRAVPRMGEGSAGQLLAVIERSKRAELWRFVLGLGLPGVGRVKAKALAESLGSLETLEHQIDSPETRALVRQLRAAGVQPVVSGAGTATGAGTPSSR